MALTISTSIASASAKAQTVNGVLFGLVNAERLAAGLPVLKINPLLAQAAEEKALDMMARGYFDHTSPNGREFFSWIDERGYKYSIAGENIAVNVYALSPEKIVESWMNSPTHRANILSEKYSETGVGVASGTFEGKQAVFAVQLFASPLESHVPSPSTPIESSPSPTENKPAQTPLPQETIVKSAMVSAAPKPQSVKTASLNPQALASEKTVASSPTIGTSSSSAPSAIAPIKSEQSNGLWTTIADKIIQFIHALFRQDIL